MSYIAWYRAAQDTTQANRLSRLLNMVVRHWGPGMRGIETAVLDSAKLALETR